MSKLKFFNSTTFPIVVLAKNNYDELDQLTKKSVGRGSLCKRLISFPKGKWVLVTNEHQMGSFHLHNDNRSRVANA